MRWSVHPNFPDYKISENCNVVRTVDTIRSCAGTVIKGSVQRNGYLRFKLVQANGKKTHIRSGRLMLETFVGEAPSKNHQAAHNDGSTDNNKIGNLRWATPKENRADQDIHGTSAFGKKIGTSVLDDEKVIALRKEYTGERGNLIHLARKYHIGCTTVLNVVHKRTWQHVA